MPIPTFTMRELMQAGVHFGHHPRRWNPKMKPYLYGVRNNIHIINLEKTFPLLERALKVIREEVAKGGRVLFVGTKRQGSQSVAEEAKRCGQYYINHRWLGGTLTNWRTISNSIRRLRELEQQLAQPEAGLTKKELLKMQRLYEKLERSLGGIKEMGGLPHVLFVIDTNKEKLAIDEAKTLGIPVVAILDSNSDPEGITYPIPGNDDAIRSIEFYCHLVSSAILDGLQVQISTTSKDPGASEKLLEEVHSRKNPKRSAPSEDKNTISASLSLSHEETAGSSSEAVSKDEAETSPSVVE